MRIIKRIIRSIVDLLYPDTCPFCGNISKGICASCRRSLKYISEPKCMRCGKPIQNERKEYCYDCENRHHYFKRGHALWLHEGIVKTAIYQFKFHDKRVYGQLFSEELFASYGTTIKRWDISMIVPIPLNKKRLKKRGYNQAEILALELSRLSGVLLCKNGLERKKQTKPQKQLGISERKKNIRSAFQWVGSVPIKGNVLLIDDIYTTGNTIDEAAKVLLEAGAPEVYFLTISIGQGN